MLLELPPEVLQNILWHMDPGTLLVCLLVSKRFLESAHTKRILLHHLRSLPGLTVGLEDLSTYDAFMLFRQRATRNLCGSGVLAQLTRYSAGQRKVNVPLCVFHAGVPACLAVAYRDCSVIRLYEFKEQSIRPEVDLRPHLFQGEDPDGHIGLLKIAFSEARDVAGLYTYTPHIGNGGPLVKEAIEASRFVLKLVLYKYFATPPEDDMEVLIEELMDTGIYSTRQETSDILIREGDIEPVGLAISNDGLICIAWSKVGHGRGPRIYLYARDRDRVDACGYGESAYDFLTLSSYGDTSHQTLCASNLKFRYMGDFMNRQGMFFQLTPLPSLYFMGLDMLLLCYDNIE